MEGHGIFRNSFDPNIIPNGLHAYAKLLYILIQFDYNIFKKLLYQFSHAPGQN